MTKRNETKRTAKAATTATPAVVVKTKKGDVPVAEHWKSLDAKKPAPGTAAEAKAKRAKVEAKSAAPAATPKTEKLPTLAQLPKDASANDRWRLCTRIARSLGWSRPEGPGFRQDLVAFLTSKKQPLPERVRVISEAVIEARLQGAVPVAASPAPKAVKASAKPKPSTKKPATAKAKGRK